MSRRHRCPQHLHAFDANTQSSRAFSGIRCDGTCFSGVRTKTWKDLMCVHVAAKWSHGADGVTRRACQLNADKHNTHMKQKQMKTKRRRKWVERNAYVWQHFKYLLSYKRVSNIYYKMRKPYDTTCVSLSFIHLCGAHFHIKEKLLQTRCPLIHIFTYPSYNYTHHHRQRRDVVFFCVINGAWHVDKQIRTHDKVCLMLADIPTRWWCGCAVPTVDSEHVNNKNCDRKRKNAKNAEVLSGSSKQHPTFSQGKRQKQRRAMHTKLASGKSHMDWTRAPRTTSWSREHFRARQNI